MKPLTIAGIVLVVIGIVGLVYGGFSYTKQSEAATLGPIELTVRENKTVNVPVWLGVGTILAGAAMIVVPRIKT